MTAEYSPITEPEQRAIVTLCLLAGLADGTQSELERGKIQELAERFSTPDLKLAGLVQEARSGQASWREAAAALASEGSRAMAYEMAVGICAVDGAETPSEKQFLKALREALRLDPAAAAAIQQSAASLTPGGSGQPPLLAEAGRGEEIDDLILNRAILAGALELMPQSLATMAIVPVQLQTVYAVGKKFGYELDWSHAKEFVAVLGVGMASQMVEGYLTRLVGTVTKRFAGRIAGALLNQATQSALAFGTTYAIGHAAKAYYSGGRTLSQGQLRSAYSSLLEQGETLKTRYGSQILDRSRSMKLADLIPLAGRG